MAISIVDDDPLSVDFLAMHLKAAGHKPLIARNAQEVLEHVRSRRSRIVISDWLMPDMNGLDLCAAVRADQGPEYVYFIMVTVLTKVPRLIEAFEAGVDDFISKPLCEGELLARLRAGIRLLQAQDQLRRDAARLAELNRQLARSNERLSALALTDELTSLPNRRGGMRRLAEEWAIAERDQLPLVVALADVAGLKRINDLHGYAAGDHVLQRIGQVLHLSLRHGDMVCRTGGDKFLILFRNHDARQAAIAAERCREAVEHRPFIWGQAELRVVLSIGLAEKTPAVGSPGDLIQAADAALCMARKGRETPEGAQAADAAPQQAGDPL